MKNHLNESARRLAYLYSAPGHKLRRANQIIVAKFHEHCGDIDITPVQYALMTAIAGERNSDATRLSGMIAFDRATLGNVIDRLERRGLVERSAHPSDRRIKVLSLTDAGERLLAKVQPLVESSQSEFLSVLSKEERAKFDELLDKIIDANAVAK